jgi:hypothetical protein
MLSGGTAFTAIGQHRLHGVAVDADAHRAIVPGLYGYVLLLSGVIALLRPSWTGLLAAFFVLFVIVMRSRPEQHQI